MRVLIYFGFLVVSLTVSAQVHVDSAFTAGNKAYFQKDYNTAINYYHQILERDHLSKELFLNLGNAYFDKGELARSIWSYESGLKYFPNNASIQKNLELVKSEVETEIFEVDDFVILKLWKSFSRVFATGTWGLIQILLSLMVVLSLYFWLLDTERNHRRKAFIAISILIPLLFISFLAGRSSYKSKFISDHGIVSSNIELKEGPDKRSGNILPLSEGVKVEIADQIGEWYKVRLLNKQEGWVYGNDLYLI